MEAGQDPANPNAVVDPSRTCPDQEKVFTLVSCKDNCRGGDTFKSIKIKADLKIVSVRAIDVVTGGSTLVAASLVAGTGIFTPAVAAVIGLNLFLVLSLKHSSKLLQEE